MDVPAASVKNIWEKTKWLPGLRGDRGLVSLSEALMFLTRVNSEKTKYGFLTTSEYFQQIFFKLVCTMASQIDAVAKGGDIQREPPEQAVMRFTYGSERAGWHTTLVDRQFRSSSASDLLTWKADSRWSVEKENVIYMAKSTEATSV